MLIHRVTDWVLALAGGYFLVQFLWDAVLYMWRYTTYQTKWDVKWGAPGASVARTQGSALERPWAVVTGCTDGIGKEFALQLAAKGYNVFMLSRDEDKLREMSDLVTAYGVEAETRTVDFATATTAEYNSIKALVDTKHVRVLINNVGAGYKFPQVCE